ncbi:hypothetical protein [Hymenobacter bucti]|uniref:Uncharacterized protein n=1 Tax=Hymenobacter bucti TaxID=1844114 RepID=A0ABW4QUJ0_9BACT
MLSLCNSNLRWLLALPLLLGGCQAVRPAAGSAADTSGYCAAPRQLFSSDTVRATAANALPLLDTIALAGLSVRSRQLVPYYGLTAGLRLLQQLRGAGLVPASAGHAAFLRQRRLLVLAVGRESAQVLRVAEELDCERQRAEQAALALTGTQSKRQNHFTVGSLLAGGASGILGTTVQNNDLNLVLTLSTAVLSAALGVATLLVNPQLTYPIRQNLLADIWYQRRRSLLYPPGLWAALGEVRAGEPAASLPPPLQTIRQRWTQYDQFTSGNAAQQAQQQALYFGAGGSYHVADLHTRASMLAEVEGYVRLANQDLQHLQVEISQMEAW